MQPSAGSGSGLSRTLNRGRVQATSSWRKVQPRLEGEPSFEACDKVDRLEVFQAHLKCVALIS